MKEHTTELRGLRIESFDTRMRLHFSLRSHYSIPLPNVRLSSPLLPAVIVYVIEAKQPHQDKTKNIPNFKIKLSSPSPPPEYL